MPSKSKKQRRFMAAAANNPKFAKKAGIKQSVAQEFHSADKQKFRVGGLAQCYGRAQPQQQMRGNDMFYHPSQRQGVINKPQARPMPPQSGPLNAAQGPQAAGTYNRAPMARNRQYGRPAGSNPGFAGRFGGGNRPNVPNAGAQRPQGGLAGARVGITPGNRQNPLLSSPRSAFGRQFGSFR